jgi:quercetin dioxygenase-like cupin family protein
VSDSPHASQFISPKQAYNLIELIDITPGTVASRTLVKGPSGTMTLFGFDRGEGLSEHSAPFDAWVYVLQGRVRLTIGGAPVDAGTGQIVCMPANVPHAVHALEQLKMLLVLYK